MRRHNANSLFIFFFVIFARSYNYNGGSFWQAEPIRRAPAKHAATARDRNRVAHVDRDRNRPLISEGYHAHRRNLIR